MEQENVNAANSRSHTTRVEQYLARIALLDGKIHAWTHVDAAGALAQAGRLDAPPNESDDVLSGFVIGVKDIIDVAGMPTRRLAALARRARGGRCAGGGRFAQAGAIVLGKTTTCELACFDPSPTRNPWNLAHTPGGSSAGSAAAVACGMCDAAIGTQTGGSILRPAAYCGVVGFKPQFRDSGRAGIVPVSERLDHVGSFARTVDDAFRVLEAAGLSDEPPDDSSAVDPIRSPRLGVFAGFFRDQCDASLAAIFQKTIAKLANAGALIAMLPEPPELERVLENHRKIMAHDVARAHGPKFEQHREAFGPQVRELIDQGSQITADEYRAAREHQVAWTSRIDATLGEFDAIMTPATPSTAPRSLATTGDPRFNSPWSYAGTPAVSVPCGLDKQGMPAGLQIIAALGRCRWLARVAGWIESRL